MSTSKSSLQINGWPVSGTSLDVIKIFAAAFMLIDHVGQAVFDSTLPVMLFIGRASFPLFAYAVTCAILRKPDSKPLDGYLVGLLIFGVISQPFFTVALGSIHANVLFTLAAGAVVAAKIETLSAWTRHGIFLFALVSIVFPDGWDFGVVGVMLPAALLLLIRGWRPAIPWTVLFLFTMNYSHEDFNLAAFQEKAAVYGVLFLFATVIPFFVVRLSLDLKGRGRLLSRYFLYAFYPLHLALLALLKVML